MTSSPLIGYPDLIGKTAIVAGDDEARLLMVITLFADHQVHLAIIAPDRDALTHAVNIATAHEQRAEVYGVTADPTDPALWARVVPHVEQRLGPIDIAVAIGTTDAGAALFNEVSRDMASRGRGVIVAVGRGNIPAGPAPKRRIVNVGDVSETTAAGEAVAVAAAVIAAASDTSVGEALAFRVVQDVQDPEHSGAEESAQRG